MERIKVEVYGDKIARVAISSNLQNDFQVKYNRFLDEFVYLNNRIYNDLHEEREANRNDIGTYIKDTINSLRECEQIIHDIEINDDYKNEIEIPFIPVCLECETEFKPYEIQYCERCLEDKITEFENDLIM